MKQHRISPLGYAGVLALLVALTAAPAARATYAKYTADLEVGTFDLTVVAAPDAAEAEADIEAEP